MKQSLILITFLTSCLSYADNLAVNGNFIAPADLPKITSRGHGASGRGTAPQFDDQIMSELALKDKSAEASCQSLVGKQISEWKSETRQEGFYWFYNISANFECLAPKRINAIKGEKAAQLAASLKDISTQLTRGVLRKKAQVLCYDNLDEVIVDGRLQRYTNRQTCELNDLYIISDTVKIEDIVDRSEIIQNQGARQLTTQLPIYLDGRRDDEIGSDGKRVFKNLKGLSRQAATITCTVTEGDETCIIEGMIRQ